MKLININCLIKDYQYIINSRVITMNIDQNIFKKTISEIVEVLLRNISIDKSVNDVDKVMDKVLPIIEGKKDKESVFDDSLGLQEKFSSIFNIESKFRENKFTTVQLLEKLGFLPISIKQSHMNEISRVLKTLGYKHESSSPRYWLLPEMRNTIAADSMVIIKNKRLLANNLRFLRENMLWNQKELSNRSGVNESTIASYEVQVTSRTKKIFIDSIAKAFNVNTKHLLTRDLTKSGDEVPLSTNPELQTFRVVITNPQILSISLRCLISKFKLTKKEFAAIFKLPIGMVQKLSLGRGQKITLLGLNKLAKAFNIPSRQILKGDLSGVKLPK